MTYAEHVQLILAEARSRYEQLSEWIEKNNLARVLLGQDSLSVSLHDTNDSKALFIKLGNHSTINVHFRFSVNEIEISTKGPVTEKIDLSILDQGKVSNPFTYVSTGRKAFTLNDFNYLFDILDVI